MAQKDDKELAPAQAAREAAKAADPDPGAETYTREWLMAAAGAVGYPPHVIAGALSGIQKKNLTIEETQDACKAWLVTPVKEA